MSEVVDEVTGEQRLMRLAIYAVATVLITIVLTMGGCTMHSNAYEPDVEAEITLQITAQLEVEKLIQKGYADKTAAVKELVKFGTSPVAAHCGIYGWSASTKAKEVCMVAGMVKN